MTAGELKSHGKWLDGPCLIVENGPGVASEGPSKNYGNGLYSLSVAASKDTMTSLSIHRSTLEGLRGLKTGAETWDDFLERLATFYENTLTPELSSELRRRSVGRRIPLREVLQRHQELKRRGR